MDVTGTVLEAGADSVRWCPGDRVAAFTAAGTGLGEAALAEIALALSVPRDMDLAVAATVPLTWGTALGLVEAAHAGHGDAVLVTSDAGGVGTALARILNQRGIGLLAGDTGPAVKAEGLAGGHVAWSATQTFLSAPGSWSPGDLTWCLSQLAARSRRQSLETFSARGRFVSHGSAAGTPDPSLPTLAALRQDI